MEVNSDSFPLWKQSAVINQSLNLNKEAITSYQKVIDLGYFDLTLLINYIDLHINLDELKEALDVLQIAFKGYPNSEELKTRALGCKLLLEKEMKIKEKIDSAKLKKDDLELLFRLFPSLKHKKYKLFFLK